MTNQDLDARCTTCHTERAELIQMKRHATTREYTLLYYCEECFDRMREDEDGPQDDDHLQRYHSTMQQLYDQAIKQKDELS